MTGTGALDVRGYELVDEFGSGQFGVVYRARQPSVAREVAIKVVRREWAKDPEFVRRFEVEAELVAGLEHPHVVPLYDFWREPEGAYLVMRFVSGGSLRDALRAGPWSVERTARLVEQIGTALAAAHRHGIVHRDLKPANVLLDEEGNAYLSDFGIAKDIRSADTLTGTGGAPGSPAYMAPEQLEGGEISARADIYAFGLLCYEILTGQHPFIGSTLTSLITSQLRDPVPAIDDPLVPVAVNDVIAKATAKNRADRYADMNDLLTDWQQALQATVRQRLPTDVSTFIGREQELAEIDKLLRTTRILTLTGMGGAGKSRLAIETARRVTGEYSDGIYFVDFGPLTDGISVLPQLAIVLGVKEQRGRSVGDALDDYLADRSVLLVFDNCEHLLEPCARLAERCLLAGGAVRLLVTSRESVGVAGERVYPVPPMPTPDPDDSRQLENITRYDGARLFAERAEMAAPSFRLTNTNAQTVARICQILDGIPLAIELAAARVRMLPVDEIAHRLDDRFAVLSGGLRTAPARQQSLLATMRWSYDLLARPEKALLRRLSVFCGGFTLAAVEKVCPSEELAPAEILARLSRLVDASLVVPGGESARYRLLGTVQQYASDALLERREADEVRRQHALFYLQLARTEQPRLHTGQAAAFRALTVERANLRAALQWSMDSGELEFGLELVGLLAVFWWRTGDVYEGGEWLDPLLAATPNEPVEHRARRLRYAAVFASDPESRIPLLREEATLRRHLGDTDGLARALNNVALCLDTTGHWDEAAELYREAADLSSECGEATATPISNLGWNILGQGDWEKAEELFCRAVDDALERGDQLDEQWPRIGLAVIAGLLGDPKRAVEGLEECRNILRRIGVTPEMGVANVLLAWWNRVVGDLPKASALFNEGLDPSWPPVEHPNFADALLVAASIEVAGGNHTRAARLVGAGDRIHQEFGTVPWAWMQPDFDELRTALRSTLGEEGFRKATAEGVAMTVAEAVALAKDEAVLA